MAQQNGNMMTLPPTPHGADAILDEYFRERRATDHSNHAPHWGKGIRGLVLACRGSAPGVGGIPYELYRMGPFFVAARLAQGLWAAVDGEDDICLIVGASVDLLTSTHSSHCHFPHA